MGFFDILKKVQSVNQEVEKSCFSNLKYNDVNIEVDSIEIMNKLEEDFKVLELEGIDNIIKDKFIPWVKGEDFVDRDDNKIFNGLKVYHILYSYIQICEKYSPTQKEDFFGEFIFGFESSSDYTEDMLEAIEMHVYVNNGRIVKVEGYDT